MFYHIECLKLICVGTRFSWIHFHMMEAFKATIAYVVLKLLHLLFIKSQREALERRKCFCWTEQSADGSQASLVTTQKPDFMTLFFDFKYDSTSRRNCFLVIFLISSACFASALYKIWNILDRQFYLLLMCLSPLAAVSLLWLSYPCSKWYYQHQRSAGVTVLCLVKEELQSLDASKSNSLHQFGGQVLQKQVDVLTKQHRLKRVLNI